ncbi:hypothetical protein FHX08_003272 [Rhizobium sp. BK529]|uniref:hypothetical protein n=1 Tax=unclassified Rhizobium TaxID=2613769 RepID=UPI0014051B45|nr:MULTISPECIES: hypothetical protein [unclassified Rhizobium]MBB3592928.1 hypothetical protein [Rhizobium sp. BK529]
MAPIIKAEMMLIKIPREDMADLRFHAIPDAKSLNTFAGIVQAIADCPGKS